MKKREQVTFQELGNYVFVDDSGIKTLKERFIYKTKSPTGDTMCPKCNFIFRNMSKKARYYDDFNVEECDCYPVEVCDAPYLESVSGVFTCPSCNHKDSKINEGKRH